MRRLLAAVVIVVAACGGEERRPAGQEAVKAPADAVTKVTEEGPVKATVKVWPAEPRLGDAIHLELRLEAQPGVVVAAPYEEHLGRFAVAGWDTDTERRPDGGSVEVQRYTLQAPGSGKHRVPPVRLEVTDTRAAGTGSGASPGEVLTEEVPITVAMVDEARATDPLAKPRGALDASRRDYTPLWIAAVLVGLALAAGAAWFSVRGVRRARDRRARISAYEVAVRRLGELEQRGAPDEASADGWFVELSAIVRHYLEGRYQVRAPELTTEEFLQEAHRAAGLSAEHRDLLSAFLERCDRVKFAGYRPDADESLATLKAARAFVEDTRLRITEAA